VMYRDIRRDRSSFWVRIFENDDNFIVFLTNKYTYNIIVTCYPALEEVSTRGWNAKEQNYTVRVSCEKHEKTINDFIQWAENANKYIWLKTNKNTESYFSNELNCCVAVDWNISFEENKRTCVGEAEYYLKYRYPRGDISDKQAENYAHTLATSIMECFEYLPISNEENILVTSLPSYEGLNNLSWNMAKYVCKQVGATLMEATLFAEKQQVKGLPFDKKINMWKSLFDSGSIKFSESVMDKTVLIVDDLYQSGASMWTYAKYLKSMGANKVIGLVAVKSQRDSDNNA